MPASQSTHTLFPIFTARNPVFYVYQCAICPQLCIFGAVDIAITIGTRVGALTIKTTNYMRDDKLCSTTLEWRMSLVGWISTKCCFKYHPFYIGNFLAKIAQISSEFLEFISLRN